MKILNHMRLQGDEPASFAKFMLAAGMLVLCQTATAQGQGAIVQLRQFVEQTPYATGVFEQTVQAASGRQPQHSSGHFAFQRPGKFRWQYEKPYTQLLVSDGKTLWSWDPELAQVTINKLHDALGSTPAAILAGDGALENNFKLEEQGVIQGLDWVQALPKQKESAFEYMRLGFGEGKLREMEIKDNFGQLSRIVFVTLKSDTPTSPGAFHFDIPEGADVIGGE